MKIFLSYASEDRNKVNEIYQQLQTASFAPWIDHKNILPGEKWERAIEQAIRNSHIFIACLSHNSVNKRGVLQREIKRALRIDEEMLPGDIYVIPVMLEACELPESLENIQAVRLYEPDGWSRLLQAIEAAQERRSK